MSYSDLLKDYFWSPGQPLVMPKSYIPASYRLGGGPYGEIAWKVRALTVQAYCANTNLETHTTMWLGNPDESGVPLIGVTAHPFTLTVAGVEAPAAGDLQTSTLETDFTMMTTGSYGSPDCSLWVTVEGTSSDDDSWGNGIVFWEAAALW